MRQLKLLAAHRSSWLIALFLLIAIFTRLYNIPTTLQFLGDQGRDALVVANIFRNNDLVFIGPVTSVGNMYLGPLYYYFMVPFLWLSFPSPVGPAYAVAILGILTVWLMYYFGRELVGKTAALIGMGLYAITATVIVYSRFSWNPNPEPFVSLIMIYGTYKAWKNPKWWLAVAICFAVLVQLHYVTLLTAAGGGLVWLASAWTRWPEWRKQPGLFWHWFWPSLVGALVIALSFIPLVLFDYKHDGLNAKAFMALFSQEESFKTSIELSWPAKIAATIKEMHGRSLHIFFEFVIGRDRWRNTALLGVLLALLARVVIKPDPKLKLGQWVLISYLFTSILGLAFYDHSVFDHYIAYLFPVTFLVYGMALAWAWQWKVGKVLAVLAIAGVAAYNIPRWPLHNAGWTIADMAATSQTIYDRLEPGEKYNIVLLAESGDLEGQNYRYFLTTTDRPPVKTEQRGAVETLVIINEDKKLKNVVDSPIYEIVTFPDKNPKEVYTIPGGPEITILSTRQ